MKLTFTGDAMCEYRRLETYFDKKKEQYDFEEIFSGLGKFLKKSNYVVARNTVGWKRV